MKSHSATAIIFDETRTKILLQKREDFRIWAFPGGMVEANEDYASAAIREAHEETGFVVEIVRHVGDFERPQMQDCDHLYECTIIGGKIIKQSEETVDVDWFAIDNLPKRRLNIVDKYIFITLANHQDAVHETLIYPRTFVWMRAIALFIRNLRNRYFR